MTSPRTSPVLLLLGAVFLFASQVLAAAAVLGIDLGTQNIKAVLVKPGVPFDIVLTKDSRRKETAAVAFKPFRGTRKAGQFPERSYGADAMAIAARNPDEVYPNLKSLLGIRMWDKEWQTYQARQPNVRIRGFPGRATISFLSASLPEGDEVPWMVEELLAMELSAIRENAQLAAGQDSKVRSAVITIPPFYTAAETRAIRSAAELAGLKVGSVISEGLAVGLNYATTRQFPNVDEGAEPEYHLVFDMGAGSSTATVMRFQSRSVKDVGKFNKTVQEVQVIGTGWDRHLGGNELNDVIVNQMIDAFVMTREAFDKKITDEEVLANGRTLAKLTKEAERARHVLSANQDAFMTFEGLHDDVDFRHLITRPDFAEQCQSHVERIRNVFKDALRMAGLGPMDLTSVILHGGATRTPFVQKALEEAVGSADKIRTNVNSDEAAAFGAAFRAAEMSPSFRVKDIRTSEAASYAAGLTWKENVDAQPTHRELWSAGSLHGVVAETTFSDLEDFAGTFYEKNGKVLYDVKRFFTQNLTKTAAALHEKYPSCVDTKFRIGLRLRSDNGEMEIAKAVVECEAEVAEKETLMDGVKNLFGFGKKDQQPLKSEDGSAASEGESSEETKGGDESTTQAAESATSSAADPEATEEVAKEVKKKKEIVSIPVSILVENEGFPDLTKEELTRAKDRLRAYAASDRDRLKREEALNHLEGLTYRVRDLVETEEFTAKATEQEREALSDKAREFSDWLYEEGEEAGVDVFRAKIKVLEELTHPIIFRVREAKERPELIQWLKDSIERAGKVLAISRHQTKQYEDWLAKSEAEAAASPDAAAAAAPEADDEFEGLEDETEEKPTKNDARNGKNGKQAPPKPAHTEKEVEELSDVIISTEMWLRETLGAQHELPETADPVLLTSDLQAKSQALLEASVKFSSKLMPKRKDNDSKKNNNKKKGKGKAGDAAEEQHPYADLEDLIYKEDPFVKDNGEPMTEAEMQELLRRAKEWAAAQKAEDDAARQEAGKGDAAEKEEGGRKLRHDEL